MEWSKRGGVEVPGRAVCLAEKSGSRSRAAEGGWGCGEPWEGPCRISEVDFRC